MQQYRHCGPVNELERGVINQTHQWIYSSMRILEFYTVKNWKSIFLFKILLEKKRTESKLSVFDLNFSSFISAFQFSRRKKNIYTVVREKKMEGLISSLIDTLAHLEIRIQMTLSSKKNKA